MPNYPLANVSDSAHIHGSVHIEPFATVYGDVTIGAGSWIGSGVVLYDGVTIGENCHVMSGTVLSADIRATGNPLSAPVPAGAYTLRIGNGVHIEPNVTMHGEIVIGDDTWIGSNATIFDGARIGNRCRIFPGAVLAAIPQDLKFEGERTLLEIGDGTTVRECATLNRGTKAYGKTVVGKNCLIMAYVHLAHDCIVGDHVVIANAVNVAGHVEIGDYAIFGGTSAVHQFVKIGAHAMIGGGSLVRKDVPPFVKASREPVQYEGVNSLGLRRRGFPSETIMQIKEMYRYIFLSDMNTATAIEFIERELPESAERREIITFIRNAKRGIIKGPQTNNAAQDDDDDE